MLPMQRLRTKLKTSFFTGLFTTIPIIVTLYITTVVLKLLNRLLIMPFSGLVDATNIWGIRIILPIVGVIISIFIICGIGLLTANLLGKKLISVGEVLLGKVPIMNNIYTAIKQLLEILFIQGKTSFASMRVVLVEYPRKGIYSIGFVSSEKTKKLSDVIGEQVVHVYLPTALNIASGFFIIVPVKETISLDISVEDGLKLVISGGIISPTYKEKGESFTNDRNQGADGIK